MRILFIVYVCMLCMHRVWSNKQIEMGYSGWRHFNVNCVAPTACCRRHFMIHVIYIFALCNEWYKLIWRDQFENEWTKTNVRVYVCECGDFTMPKLKKWNDQSYHTHTRSIKQIHFDGCLTVFDFCWHFRSFSTVLNLN